MSLYVYRSEYISRIQYIPSPDPLQCTFPLSQHVEATTTSARIASSHRGTTPPPTFPSLGPGVVSTEVPLWRTRGSLSSENCTKIPCHQPLLRRTWWDRKDLTITCLSKASSEQTFLTVWQLESLGCGGGFLCGCRPVKLPRCLDWVSSLTGYTWDLWPFIPKTIPLTNYHLLTRSDSRHFEAMALTNHLEWTNYR